MRFIALDVHRDFCEVAIAEGGQVRGAGRVKTTPDELGLFAQSLGADDQVVLEASGNALAIARIMRTRCANARRATQHRRKGEVSKVEEHPPMLPESPLGSVESWNRGFETPQAATSVSGQTLAS